MSYIIRRKVRKAIYVYECTSYRNKEGKPRSKQKYLGKLDNDGILITSKRKIPVQITEVKTITKRFILNEISPKTSRNTHTSRQERTENIPASENDTQLFREQSYSRVRPNTGLQAQPVQTQRISLQAKTSQESAQLSAKLWQHAYLQEMPSSSGQTAAHTQQSLHRLPAMPANMSIFLCGQVLRAFAVNILQSQSEFSEVL